MKRLQIRVRGLVQGVFFRVSAQRRAEELALTGLVRNEPDDSVYIEAEGSENALDEFLAWCRRGPSRARVERVDFVDMDVRKSVAFTIED